MNSLASKITDSELELMAILWKAGRPLPVAQIRKELEGKISWEASTIKTLLRRLCVKGVISFEKQEVYYYKPLITQEQYKEYSTQTLINKIYNGSVKNLVASLLGSSKLSEKDIKELKDMFVGEDNNE